MTIEEDVSKLFENWYYRPDGGTSVDGEAHACAKAGFLAGWRAAKGVPQDGEAPVVVPEERKLTEGFKAPCGCTLAQAPVDYLGEDERKEQEDRLAEDELPMFFVCVQRADLCPLHPSYHLYRMEPKELIGLL